MIFVVGGFVILIVSFVFAFYSLMREQRTVPRNDLPRDQGSSQNARGTAVVASDDLVKPPESMINPEEQNRLAKREEAYRILQSRVMEMTSQSTQQSVDAQQPAQLDDPDTNIEDTAEADIALSQKVPLPWEDKAEPENIPVVPQTSQAIFQAPVERKKDDENSDKLSGQINIGDLGKREE